ncbi:MAG TPA: hypothetical protein PKC30_00415 [Saprospiraceae bacterium]|nr:hypothetical protein [Saprospiraceae bacterium]
MSEVLIKLVEVLLYTVPALVVFATVYFLFKKYLENQWQLDHVRYRREEGKNLIPVRLQAYERLTLYFERIKPEALLMRLIQPEMTGKSLQNAMMIAIQKEFEHNLTQQIYISENLWKIASLAKDETLKIIGKIDTSEDIPAHVFGNEIIALFQKIQLSPIDQALKAIRKETGLILSK